ncbi:hypothetical protein [Ruminococcus sp.]|uniref:hypothetical protein n=1 Tax=Ruminococcus sp. TaxID=41978 RepID=UPI001B68FF59|nr:hypothetical protein [Ruminococcus sp.]MBP5430802.1 hypothetical protein [Ruminococcus sp.]
MSEKMLNELANCKICGKTVFWGELIWLHGRCMCPKCYEEAKEKERNDDYQAEHS